MKKTYTPKELEKQLGITNHNLYNWIRYTMPEEMKPKRGHNEELNRETYIFTSKDLENLLVVKELKSDGLTYEEIKEQFINEVASKSDDEITVEEEKEFIYAAPETINTNDLGEYTELQESRNLRMPLMVLSIIILILNLLILYKVF